MYLQLMQKSADACEFKKKNKPTKPTTQEKSTPKHKTRNTKPSCVCLCFLMIVIKIEK